MELVQSSTPWEHGSPTIAALRLLTVSMAATYFPAARTSHLDPAEILRAIEVRFSINFFVECCCSRTLSVNQFYSAILRPPIWGGIVRNGIRFAVTLDG